MKVTTKGQVTIPQHIRRYLGVSAHSEVDFLIRGREVVIVSRGKDEETTASRFEAMRGSRNEGLSTDEWMRATRED
ncbi:AbrB/MazE/SpoVT family DNA-binding domain-containing protein [Haloferula chungangensis]|uniref:AbrB/MazE/SpoVT family DNA-binding domain-containing protein n=1 Tax=Haloferula chungangensis TaxID=1048331 RepID=A0ABW2L6M4_9BACT